MQLTLWRSNGEDQKEEVREEVLKLPRSEESSEHTTLSWGNWDEKQQLRFSLNRRFGRREEAAGHHGEREHRDSAVSMATPQPYCRQQLSVELLPLVPQFSAADGVTYFKFLSVNI